MSFAATSAAALAIGREASAPLHRLRSVRHSRYKPGDYAGALRARPAVEVGKTRERFPDQLVVGRVEDCVVEGRQGKA